MNKLSITNKLPQINNLPGTPKQFLIQYNPQAVKKLMFEAGINTIYKASISESVKLHELRKFYNIDLAVDYIQIWIISLNNYFCNNKQKQMNTEQIIDTSMLLLENFFYLKLTEFAMVCKNIKLGKYGELYGTLNGHYILKCFRLYAYERLTVIHRIKKKKLTSPVNEKDIVPMPDSLKSKIKKLTAKWNQNKG